jgi:simple sugar transport system substrate-binding protein
VEFTTLNAARRLTRRRGCAGRALTACVALVACGQGAEPGSSEGAPSSDLPRSDVRFVVVTHGSSADPFWSVVINGVNDAGSDMGVRVEYQSPNTFDMVAMSQMLDAAVASRPNGLIVSIPDADALGGSIRAAVAAGIPVVSINSGLDVYASLGALAHVGQPEREAGRAGGERLLAGGARRVLCVNHEVGNVALDRRCLGLEDAVEGTGSSTSVLAVDLADPEDTRQRVRGALVSDASIDAMLLLGAIAVEPALVALREAGRAGAVRVATFDLSPEVLEAIAGGDVLFAIDQQQYLQGYLPVVYLTKYLETGTMPGGGQAIPTGPGFVTRENAERVMGLAERGLR